MQINHIIIGCENTDESRDFYTKVLGLEFFDSFIDTGTKKQGHVLVKKQEREIELLLVPFNEERLPSPQHLAFEVTSNEFDSIYQRAGEMKLNIRAMPPLDCKIKGVGTTEVRGRKIERFYLLDPARVNIEIMREV